VKNFVVAAALAATLAGEPRAEAYEFWLRAQTIGQGYQLREFKLVGPDLFLGRRRYVETLALRIWDIGNYAHDRRKARLPERGIRIAWQSYLRVDHDFGTYTTGRIALPNDTRRDALDVIPELASSVASLQLLYGYAQVEGLFDDRVTVQLGRTLADDGWGTTAIDGAVVRGELPGLPLALTATAGLRVRDASPMGISAFELDGTSGAGCQEFVENATGGGTWRLIDRDRAITNTRLGSDYEYCPQREVRQPVIGVQLATSKLRTFGVELGYRRTSSATVGLIGTEDRLTFPDRGLYPTGAPASGVNEERLWARGHATFRAGSVQIDPYVGVRASLLHAKVDRGLAGVRLTRGAHVLEPMLDYFYPTFDGDSIFNVFSIEPTADARLAYRYAPATGWRGLANAWIRKYVGATEDAWAGGGDAGVERALSTAWRARATALADTGYGGRRIGGSLELGWRPKLDWRTYARGQVIGLREDTTLTEALARRTVTSAGTVGVSWRFSEFVTIHLTSETAYDPVHALQFRAIAILDLGYRPEM